MQELQSQIDKLHREKLALEDKVVELSSYQKEVVALRNEITKMQVSNPKPTPMFMITNLYQLWFGSQVSKRIEKKTHNS
jgi:hypothetical protein